MSLALKNRASALKRARAFFDERGIREVDVPQFSRFAPVDLHIDPIVAATSEGPRYLHTSPEYAMKRLLAEGSGDIYYLGHVFRDGELGRRHCPEFTMAEWYRIGFSMQQMIDETLEFIRLFTGDAPVEQMTYSAAFARCGLSPDEDPFLHMATIVEPSFAPTTLTVITHFPVTQAALAVQDEQGAHRFEIFFRGLELCNGYHELRDAGELRARFAKINEERTKPLPIDTYLLDALTRMPACSGVAVGFDRLLMIEAGATSIDEILYFPWDRI